MKSKNTPHILIPMKENEKSALKITYSFHTTPYGETLIASTPKGICYLALGDKEQMLKELKQRYAKAEINEQLQSLHAAAAAVVSEKSDEKIPLHVSGTDFQLKVWDALLHIPRGSRSTYKAIAKGIGKPNAVRATGTAVGQNPVSHLIPCHRVVRTDGGLGGYHWGIEIKKQMLDNEK